MRVVVSVALAVALLFASAKTAFGQARSLSLAGVESGRRLALVIGNAAYRTSALRNPANDATDVAAALTKLKFQVTLVTDAPYVPMSRAIDRFVGEVARGDVALVYYAGHGIQVDGENYLLPVDFELPAASDTASVKYFTSHNAYSATLLHDRLDERGVRLKILILDACRTNPFRQSRALGEGGLAAMTGRGSYIAFAAAANSTADDNMRGRNGLFTGFLLEELAQSDLSALSIDQVFSRVREKVADASGGRQIPWAQTSLIGEFHFVVSEGPVTPEKAEAEGRLSEALDGYLEVLAAQGPFPVVADELQLRRQIVGLAMRISPRPQPSNAAMVFARRGEQALSQNTGLESLRTAEDQFHRAVLSAPWYADALLKLGTVEEKLGHTELAIVNLKMYLVTNPASPGPARDKVAELGDSLERTIGDLSKACDVDTRDGGDARSCTKLGIWVHTWKKIDELADFAGYLDDVKLFDRSCDRGDFEGCRELVNSYEEFEFLLVELGDIYLNGRPGIPADGAKAVELYQRACKDSQTSGCLSLAVMYSEGIGVPKDLTRAAGFYTMACGATSALGCYEAQKTSQDKAHPSLKHRTPVFFSLAESLQARVFERACDAGKNEACLSVGRASYGGDHGIPVDKARAAMWFQRACDAGVEESCGLLGSMYKDGDGVSADPKHAMAAFQRGCDAGEWGNCRQAGDMHLAGLGVPRDLARGIALYQRACDGSPDQCTSLGIVYLTGGEGRVPIDYGRARELFQRACDSVTKGDGYMFALMGCRALGVIFEQGKGVAVDLPRAATLYQQACDGRALPVVRVIIRDGVGCQWLGAMYENGTGVKKDLPRARALYEQGCDAGVKDACEALKRLTIK